MSAYFLDSSAIVKRYLAEAGTAWVQALCHPNSLNDLYVARIALVEVASAIARRQRNGLLSPAAAASILSRFRQDLITDFFIVEITASLLETAAGLADTRSLRAYDAVQLAAAMEAHSQRTTIGFADLVLVSADLDLNTAASTCGLPTEDPNRHP